MLYASPSGSASTDLSAPQQIEVALPSHRRHPLDPIGCVEADIRFVAVDVLQHRSSSGELRSVDRNENFPRGPPHFGDLLVTAEADT